MVRHRVVASDGSGHALQACQTWVVHPQMGNGAHDFPCRNVQADPRRMMEDKEFSAVLIGGPIDEVYWDLAAAVNMSHVDQIERVRSALYDTDRARFDALFARGQVRITESSSRTTPVGP